jgi:hypothetical protein
MKKNSEVFPDEDKMIWEKEQRSIIKNVTEVCKNIENMVFKTIMTK